MRSTISTCCSDRRPSKQTNRFITASMANLLNDDISSRYIQDALGDAATKNVSSTGGRSALLSFFGKLDYNYADTLCRELHVAKGWFVTFGTRSPVGYVPGRRPGMENLQRRVPG